MLDPRTVASTYVRTLLAAVEAQGIAPDLVLQGLAIDAGQLAAANGRLGVLPVHRIWQRALALTHDPLLGLKVAENVKPGTFRVLGLAAMSSATLAEAVTLMLRYHRLVSEAGALSAGTLPTGDIRLFYTEQTMRFQLLPQQVEAIIGGIVRQAAWLAGRTVTPVAVSFKHAAQGAAADYQAFFGVAVAFGAEQHAITLAAQDVQAALPQADADLCRVHCQLADQQLASLSAVGFVTNFAVQWLATQASGAMRIDDLALTLGLSVRSLQRQLQTEGQSWTSVVDSARQQGFVALRQQGLSLAETAQRLGYHDASSLSRAARRWFGVTPD